ncbi:MAG: flagellar hook basal-body protein [Hyphomonadaceae bacterium]|nr:MAG: flgG [Caulobacteraceae bacterium]MBT9445331.1 flagellar hook basal-body protein [Hyphomonadaceae bacterium]TPW04675.1 MAG: flgG [Alphaproteobacteria bacterium]
MSAAFEIAGVGMQAQRQALEVSANNIANINTPGFRRSTMRFSEIIGAADAVSRADLGGAGLSAGLTASAVVDWDAQGEIERTGRALDLAINGRGFIELVGAGGEVLLWRGGPLEVGEDGLLAAPNGAILRAGISVPDDAQALEISSDGQVRATFSDRRASVELGHVPVVRVASYANVERLDGGYARVESAASLIEATAGQEGAGVFVQGALERSSVDLNAEMVRLLIVQRAYAANVQVAQAADQLSALANNLRK